MKDKAEPSIVDEREIKSTFRQIAKAVHPDRHSGASPSRLQELACQFDQARCAYQLLLSAFDRAAKSAAS